MGSQPQADITLYTNHRCPFAHRAHITLQELGLPFKEEIIDLDTPRSPEYLQINPRGLVPTIIHNGQTITESAIVAQYLVDAYPNTLLPASSDRNGPLVRARISFFADTYSNKVQSHIARAIYRAKTDDEINQAADDALAGIVKEVLTAPFVIRILTLSKHGVLPTNLISRFEHETPNFYRWAQAIGKNASVLKIYDEDQIVQGTKKKRAQLQAQAN
ncbi:related to glutathione transferase omega 1 [Fusarium torulosum]|uniref:Related to glutathione transferase omega 1 n=1 Tax=Fusarium torulosum TaxID=33205 RepID=A0AAE8MJC8_9HYPO|nr:related to glutathione transferase omega 1 [Fusarium torulosum]